MFQSNGTLRKSTITLWEGHPRDWPANLPVGDKWSSYAELYRRQLWVSTVIDKRAKAAARLPFKVYQRDTDGRLGASDSPFGRLMARPSRSIDPFSFWLWTVSTKDIHGEAPWLKVRDKLDRPVELLPIHPTKLHDETDGRGRTTWQIRLSSGTIDVKREDLVLHREFNPDTMFRGMSKLEPLRSTLENEDGARRANSALWRNGGRPSVVLQHPKELSDGTTKKLSAQWADVHGGVDNWAKALVLEEGMTANVLPINVTDLEYIESRKLNREEVCAAFDMAPPVVHILDRATFSNITEQHRSMYRDTMGTVLGALESTVEFELRDGRFGEDREPDFGDAFYGEFLLDEVLRGAFEARTDAYLKATYMTIAEKREKENLPFIPGTDFIFLNSATLPLGPDGLLVQPTGADVPGEVPDGAVEPRDDEQEDSAARVLQQVYLAVGAGILTADEARELAGLTGPAPTVSPTSVRSVLGRLGRAKTLDDVTTDDPLLTAMLAQWGKAGVTVEAARSGLAALATSLRPR